MKSILKSNIPLVVIFILGLVIRIVYLSYTDYQTRQYDVIGGHLTYIEYVAAHRETPPVSYCWECWQPPLYYGIAAVVYNTLQGNNFIPATTGLQLLSFFFSVLFLLYGYQILQLLLRRKILFYLGCLLITFWPSGIINSARISNDVLYYVLSSALLYYILNWTLHKRRLYLVIASLFAALSIITKTNGIVGYAALITIMAIRILQEKKHNKPDYRTYFLAGTILFTGFIAGFANVILNHTKMIATIDSLNPGLLVKNSLFHFTFFDVKTFVTKPFIHTWTDMAAISGGRQFFWNFLLKTSLFGEFEFPNPAQIILGRIISVLLLIMLLALLIRVFYTRLKKTSATGIALIVYAFFSVVAVLAYRIKYAHNPNGDFRFIFPVIIPIAYALMRVVDALSPRHRILAIALSAIILSFSLLSFIFFLFPVHGTPHID